MCVCLCWCPRRFFGCLAAVFQASNCFGKSYVEQHQQLLPPFASLLFSCSDFTKNGPQMHNVRSLIVILKRNYILWESWKKQPNQFECRLISSCFILPSFWQFRLRFIKVNMKTLRHKYADEKGEGTGKRDLKTPLCLRRRCRLRLSSNAYLEATWWWAYLPTQVVFLSQKLIFVSMCVCASRKWIGWLRLILVNMNVIINLISKLKPCYRIATRRWRIAHIPTCSCIRYAQLFSSSALVLSYLSAPINRLLSLFKMTESQCSPHHFIIFHCQFDYELNFNLLWPTK